MFRYGIPVESLAKLLRTPESPAIFAIFVGSLGDQAERLKRKLPHDRAFVCSDASQVPLIFRRIFEATISNESS